jgi:predicted ester cyclase
MSSEDNKAIVRRIHDEINRGNLAIVDELYAPDYLSHVGHRTGGLPEYKEYLASHRAAFPDWHTTIEDLMADGDKVVARVSEHGSHKGEWRHRYLGRIAPTHKAVNSTRIIIRRIRNGKVVESWINADHLGMLHQVGALGGLHKTTS